MAFSITLCEMAGGIVLREAIMQNPTGIQPESRVVGVVEFLPAVLLDQPVPHKENAEKIVEPNRTWLSIALVVLAGGLRLLSPIPNCTPVGALALFGGGRLRSWLAFALPVLVMLGTDAVKSIPLGRQGYAAVDWLTPWIYACFLLNVLPSGLAWPLFSAASSSS
jgi:hypothetical protein